MGLEAVYGDEELKREGKWFPIKGGGAELTPRVKLRHVGNPAFGEFLRNNLTPDQRGFINAAGDTTAEEAVGDEDLPDVSEEEAAEALETIREGIATHVVVDWEDITVESEDNCEVLGVDPDEPIECTTENVLALFDAIPAFEREIRNVAQNRAKFVRENEGDDQKN